jgi:hypothetical protein
MTVNGLMARGKAKEFSLSTATLDMKALGKTTRSKVLGNRPNLLAINTRDNLKRVLSMEKESYYTPMEMSMKVSLAKIYIRVKAYISFKTRTSTKEAGSMASARERGLSPRQTENITRECGRTTEKMVKAKKYTKTESLL